MPSITRESQKEEISAGAENVCVTKLKTFANMNLFIIINKRFSIFIQLLVKQSSKTKFLKKGFQFCTITLFAFETGLSPKFTFHRNIVETHFKLTFLY